MPYNIEDFASVLTNYGLLGDLPRTPIEINILEIEKEKRMLVCPTCGSHKFSGELTITAQVTNVRPSHERIVGMVSSESNITVTLVCEKCGSTPSFEDLKNTDICSICGRPVGDIYYQSRTKSRAKAHPACLSGTQDWIYHNDNSQ